MLRRTLIMLYFQGILLSDKIWLSLYGAFHLYKCTRKNLIEDSKIIRRYCEIFQILSWTKSLYDDGMTSCFFLGGGYIVFMCLLLSNFFAYLCLKTELIRGIFPKFFLRNLVVFPFRHNPPWTLPKNIMLLSYLQLVRPRTEDTQSI